MVGGARRVNGRHARAVTGVPGKARAAVAARRTQLVVGGAAGLGLALTGSLVAFVAHLPGRTAAAPRAAAANALAGAPAPAPAAMPRRPTRGARAGDQAALAFYQGRDPAHAAHVTEAVWTGPMLRVYTNLPSSEADSKTAIALCETAAAYAEGRDRIPVVFVHADRASGYQVLANKMDMRDDCRLGRVP
jgi:hypothetical protein